MHSAGVTGGVAAAIAQSAPCVNRRECPADVPKTVSAGTANQGSRARFRLGFSIDHMRILHITPGYYPAVGGAEVYTKELSERLVKRGHDVTVLTMRDTGGALPASEVINEVRVD